MSKDTLKLDWCNHTAAKFAVEHWHYSRSMPAGKVVKIGVWECDKFIGCVLFSSGSTPRIGHPYGLQIPQICELTRIALSAHINPVSRIMSIALKMLKNNFAGLRMVVSYADPQQGHYGGVYQATNWLYVGESQKQISSIIINGKPIHKKTVVQKYGTANPERIMKLVNVTACNGESVFKHKYLYPLDGEMRQQVESLRKPYPRRAGSITADAPAILAGEGGAAPTAALWQKNPSA